MNSDARQGMLKRPRVSTTSNASARRPLKRKKESGEFNENNLDKNKISSDESDCPTLLRSLVNDSASGDRAGGRAPRVPRRPRTNTLAGPSLHSQLTIHSEVVHGSERILRHSQSLGRLMPRGRGAMAQKGLGRARSVSPNAQDSSSDDEIDILGEVRRLWKQSCGGALVEPRSNQTESAVGSSRSHDDSAPAEGSRRQSEPRFSRQSRDYISSAYQSLDASKPKQLTEDGSKFSEDSSDSSEDSSEDYNPSQEPSSPSPDRFPGGLKKPPISTSATVIAAYEDGITAFVDDASNAVTENLDTGSSELYSDPEDIRDDLPQDERLEATLKLGAEDKQIKSLFEDLGLPLSPDRIPINAKSDSKNVEYHTASTVTQEILEEHGSWEFPTLDHWNVNGKRKIIHTVEAYVPISLDGDLLDIMVPPTEVNGTYERGDLDLSSNIHAFLDGRKDYIEGRKNKIYLDKADATNATRNDEVDNALLMPVQYQEILDLHEKEMELRQRNLEWGIDPSLGDGLLPRSSPLRHFEVDTPESNSQPGSASFSTNQESPSSGQSCKVQFVPSIQATSAQKHSNPFKETPSTLSRIEASVAEMLIEQHKLKPTLADAQELERLLREKEADYARRRSRQRLCQRTGTAAERSQLQRAGRPISLPSIEYAPKGLIEERDKESRVGNAMMNRDASNPNFGAAERILKWIDLQPLKPASVHAAKDSKGSRKVVEENLSEVTVEAHVGPLVKGIFWEHEHLRESENKSLRFLDCLRLFGTNPKADYAVRLSGVDWLLCGFLLALCLLSGECKPSRNFGTKTEAQMAMNSVATLIVLILMHLSTRKSANQKLLPWMFIYAFCYTEQGIAIYAHFPQFVVSPDGKGGKWKFVSWKVTDKFQDMWAKHRTEDLRMRGLATLYLMRSHTEFVLEQLLAWSKNLPHSALPIIDRLIARSHLELEQWDWLIRKAHEGKGNRIAAA